MTPLSPLRRATRTAAAIGALLAVVAVVSSCENASTNTDMDWNDALVAQLVALGFRRDMIQDLGDRFRVEGDIIISKAAVPRLLQHRPLTTFEVLAGQRQGGEPHVDVSPPLFQWNTNVLVAQPVVENIRVDLSGLASQPA
jgi:hypothetical protein